MTTTVEMLDRDEIEGRRQALVLRAGLSEVELKARGTAYVLTDAQAAILDEIEDLDFLLGA